MVVQTKEDIESLQNGDICFIPHPETGELLSAVYYDRDGSHSLGSSGYWIRPCQYNSCGLRVGTIELLITTVVNKCFSITGKRN